MSPIIGILEWFRPGEYEQVERVLADLKAIGVQQLRTGVSWADWHTPEGKDWYDWLIPRIAQEVELLPCFHYTPPSLGIEPKTSAPPRNPKDFADFIDVMITQFGQYFEWVELWNEPNNLPDWDWRIDPSWQMFCKMIGGAAYWAQQRGKKTVLAGMAPIDPHWLSLMGDRGVLNYIDAIGLHGFPGTWEFDWQDWVEKVESVRSLLHQYNLNPELWITETGFSTWRHDQYEQLQAFLRAISAPVDRVYWYSLYDLHEDISSQEGFHVDEKHYHMGLKFQDGNPKLLYRLWERGGIEFVEEMAAYDSQFNLENSTSITAIETKQKPILITGGSGFIGTNLAHRLASNGQSVLILDNLSRPGVEQNLCWLRQQHGDLISVKVADMRDRFSVRNAVKNVSAVFHLAAQVAVTTSVVNPFHDFMVNGMGTLHLLEELRYLSSPIPLIFTSTNKVYGNLENVDLRLNQTRYEPEDEIIHRFGINEDFPLSFHSPYGCSKGAADQYILDYAHTFNLPTVVLRMSCIYGPHQFGTEDQGWVAHFLIRALENQPITLYGDGKQVRDILFVEDLINSFLVAKDNISQLSGQAFNIGGGTQNTTSLLECIENIGKLHGRKPPIHFEKWRPGDQRYYVSDTRKFQLATGWKPQYTIEEGMEKLYTWLSQTKPVAVATH
ncbi:MAG: GDP-mannose 4,6-dehydratase [Chroococcales cyanobacterium]